MSHISLWETQLPRFLEQKKNDVSNILLGIDTGLSLFCVAEGQGGILP